MEQKLEQLIVPSTPVIEYDPSLAWAVHEVDLREQGSQIAELKEQFRKFEEKQSALSATAVTRKTSQGALGWATVDESLGLLLQTKVRGDATTDYFIYSKWNEPPTEATERLREDHQPAVALWAALQFGSIIMLFTAMGSLVFWLLGSSPILNPFASLLAVVASPFAYLMGAAAKRR
jgi:hypothetical protein